MNDQLVMDMSGSPEGFSLDELGTNIKAYGHIERTMRHLELDVCRVAPAAFDQRTPLLNPYNWFNIDGAASSKI